MWRSRRAGSCVKCHGQPRRGQKARPAIVREARRDESRGRLHDPRKSSHEIILTLTATSHQLPKTIHQLSSHELYQIGNLLK